VLADNVGTYWMRRKHSYITVGSYLKQFIFDFNFPLRSINTCHLHFQSLCDFLRELSDINLRSISPTFGDLLDLKTL